MTSQPASREGQEADAEMLRRKIAQLEAELAAARQSARDQRAAEARLAALAEASRQFAAATTNLEDLLRTITRFVANTVGDLCSLRLIAPDGKLFQRGYIAHCNPAAEHILAVLEELPQRADEGQSGAVIRSKRSLLLPVVPPDAFRAVTPPSLLPYLDQFGISSVLIVPVVLREQAIGTLTLSRDSGASPYTADDQLMAEDIAHRAVLAIDYARSYAAEQRAREAAEQANAARNEAYALLDTLFSTAPIGLAFVDDNLRYVRVNDALAAMNGRSVEQHLGRRVPDVLPHLKNILGPLYRGVFATGQPVMNREVSGETPAHPGKQRHWLASYYPVRASEAVIGVGVIVVEITERKEAEQRLREYADEMRALSLRVVQAHEDERRHLAHELHDEIGQLLTGLNMVLEAKPDSPPEHLHAKLRAAQEVVTDLTGRVRQLSLDLRPSLLDDLGLLPTLLWHVRRFSEQTGIAVDFKHSGLDATLPPHITLAAYRIVQEGLTNVARYAGVEVARVRVWARHGWLHITVEDDGRGFDAEAALDARRSLGLVGIRERALRLGGQCSIESAPGEGTLITVALPISAEEEPQ